MTLHISALITAMSLCAAAPALAQRGAPPPPPNPTGPYTVTLVPPEHGKVTLSPALPADGKFPKGTVVTVTATPDSGYAIDSVWYSVPGRFGQMYHEGPGPSFQVTMDQDKRVGASFIETAAVKDINVTNNVVYAKPGVKPLKYDVYSPKGARNLPIIIIIHGGGWQANDEDVMRGLARELTKGGKFVVFSMDYRWAGKEDGDATPNTMADLIDDVYGGIAHIAEHASQYGGDPTRIGVTGDSAGGHLSAAVSLMTNMIGSRGFGKEPGVFEFKPSYLPKAKSAEQVRDELSKAIKAAAPSYGVFSAAQLNPYDPEHASDPAWKAAIAPLSHIPPATERAVPQFLTRGTLDPLIKDEMVKEFIDALVKAGQRAEYIQIGGASHAFFDWKPDDRTKATFMKYGVYYAARMRDFFESVLY
jgi:acetyl esterase/lipase